MADSRSFTEVSTDLAKALTEIEVKKDAFDKASTIVAAASAEYQKSVENAQYLRAELEKALNYSMGDPTSGGRIRQSA